MLFGSFFKNSENFAKEFIRYIDYFEEIFSPIEYKIRFVNNPEKKVIYAEIQMKRNENSIIETKLNIFYSYENPDKVLQYLGEELKNYFSNLIFKNVKKNVLKEYTFIDKSVFYNFENGYVNYYIKIEDIKPMKKPIIIKNFYKFLLNNNEMIVEISKNYTIEK